MRILLLYLVTLLFECQKVEATSFNYTKGQSQHVCPFLSDFGLFLGPSFREYDNTVSEFNPFSEVTQGSEWGNPMDCADFDNDGDADCLVSHGVYLRYFRNEHIGV